MPFTLADRPLVRTSPRTMLSGPPNVFDEGDSDAEAERFERDHFVSGAV
jgi:hypothetical protein